MMTCKVVFHPEAAKELSRLDNRVKIMVLKQIKKISISPTLGKALGSRKGLDLTGYRKLYVDRKKIRIVYKIVDQKVLIKIIAIGKREEMAAYQNAFDRIDE